MPDAHKYRYNRHMERKDRSHYRVRKFRLGEPEQEDEPELAKLTPSERIAMVFEINKLAWAIHDSQTADKAYDRRLPRHAWPVKKVRR